MNERTKACSISKKVRQEVMERDGGKCIFCGGTYNLEIAHYISRGCGGLGIPENLTVACHQCHSDLDQSSKKKEMHRIQFEYLEKLYPNFEGRRYYRGYHRNNEND